MTWINQPWLGRGLLALGLLCIANGNAYASGGDGFEESRFTPEHHVATSELTDYAAGSLGVLSGSYWHIYQVLAYRALTGHPTDAAALEAMHIDGWHVDGYGLAGNATEGGDAVAWDGIRAQVKAAKSMPSIVTEKDDGNYGSFINCPNDAFRAASETLAARLKTGGQAWVAVWLAGQDAVFANCGTVGDGPQRHNAPYTAVPALPTGAPAWLVADHAYQNAAALFYAEQFDAAHSAFLAIAKDAHSPYQKLSGYMAARCWLRKASLTASSQDAQADLATRNALLANARAELVAALPGFPQAQQMINYVDARLHPSRRLATLSQALASSALTNETEQDLADYLAILDTNTEAADPKDAMSNWINVMQVSAGDSVGNLGEDQPDAAKQQQTHDQALALSRKWWASTHELQWLVAVLANLHKGEATAAELKAAASVPDGASAQPTLQYHLARLALLDDHAAEADTIIRTALRGPKLATSARNRWLHLQMLSANSLEGFLAAVPRVSVKDGEAGPIPDEAANKADTGPETDGDFTTALYRDMPLTVLKAIYDRLDWPAERKAPLAEKLWTRAVVLGDWAMADSLNDALSKGRATTASLYTRFKAAQTEKERRLAAAIILVNTPELDPNPISSGGGGGAWDCEGAVYATSGIGDGDTALALVKPAFLTPAQRAEGEKQGKAVAALPVRTVYLAPPLLEWAKTKPDDPEAPKALHFFVAATRPFCQHEGANGESKAAFNLLHHLWPKSEWAKKTPYYY